MFILKILFIRTLINRWSYVKTNANGIKLFIRKVVIEINIYVAKGA